MTVSVLHLGKVRRRQMHRLGSIVCEKAFNYRHHLAQPFNQYNRFLQPVNQHRHPMIRKHKNNSGSKHQTNPFGSSFDFSPQTIFNFIKSFCIKLHRSTTKWRWFTTRLFTEKYEMVGLRHRTSAWISWNFWQWNNRWKGVRSWPFGTRRNEFNVWISKYNNGWSSTPNHQISNTLIRNTTLRNWHRIPWNPWNQKHSCWT